MCCRGTTAANRASMRTPYATIKGVRSTLRQRTASTHEIRLLANARQWEACAAANDA